MQDYDFCGWATRNNLKCADGRTIMKDAFAHQDGMIVPMVYQHNHDDVYQVLGHCLLKNDPQGVKAYGTFNNTEQGQIAKELVLHGDIDSLSIHANKLQQTSKGEVLHGDIREVSLVLAGANPGAHITNVLMHSEDGNDYELENEAILYTGESLALSHEESDDENNKTTNKVKENDMEGSEKTVQDVLDAMTEEQKKVVDYLVGAAIQEAKKNTDEGEGDMKHSIFDNSNEGADEELMHDAMNAIIADAKRYGSVKDSFLEHAAEYGIDHIDYLFPDAKNVTTQPTFIDREQDWVSKVMNGVHHTPFSRIKSMFADITADEARAKGYMKGKRKKEEVFTLLKRSTDPTTVYKKQKMDRDDVIDITDFDVIAWIKNEMRGKLDEELARAFIFGDGRLADSDDKIDETNIRPVIKDDSLFVISKDTTLDTFVDDSVEAQDNYQGSGSITGFIRKSWVTKQMLKRDTLGYRLYKNKQELATAMNLKEIVDVPDSIVPAGYVGVALDLSDYNVGADKGGAVNMFDDFDIDYNQQKYLIETRCSGALIKPYSAIVFKVAANAGSGSGSGMVDDGE